MKTGHNNRLIPENSQEFWKLYNTLNMIFIPMMDKFQDVIEVPSYEVVEKLLQGWNFPTTVVRDFLSDRMEPNHHDHDEIPF